MGAAEPPHGYPTLAHALDSGPADLAQRLLICANRESESIAQCAGKRRSLRCSGTEQCMLVYADRECESITDKQRFLRRRGTDSSQREYPG